MARPKRQPERRPIRQHGRLLYIVPSFTGRKDRDGDMIEYVVDLEPFPVWRRVQHEVPLVGGGVGVIERVKEVLQPYGCSCDDFRMRPLHPCKHIERVVSEFFPEYYLP